MFRWIIVKYGEYNSVIRGEEFSDIIFWMVIIWLYIFEIDIIMFIVLRFKINFNNIFVEYENRVYFK